MLYNTRHQCVSLPTLHHLHTVHIARVRIQDDLWGLSKLWETVTHLSIRNLELATPMPISIRSPLPRDTLTTLDIDVPMDINKSETVKHEAPWYNIHSALQVSLPSMSNLSVLAVQWSVESMKTGMMHGSFQLHNVLLYSISVHSARLACTQSCFMHFAHNS